MQSCSIVRDDSYERHFKSTMDSWQQQAAQMAAAVLAGSRPSSRETSGATGGARGAAAAAMKDRPKQAQLALDRYTAEQQQAAMPAGLTTLSIPGGAPGGHAISGGHGSARKPSHPGAKPKTPPLGADRNSSGGNAGAGGMLLDTSTSGSLQPTPRGDSSAGVVVPAAPPNKLGVPALAVRVVKGGELQITPSQQLRHIQAGNLQMDRGDAAGGKDSRATADKQAAQLVSAVQVDDSPAIGALQTQEVRPLIKFARQQDLLCMVCAISDDDRMRLCQVRWGKSSLAHAT